MANTKDIKDAAAVLLRHCHQSSLVKALEELQSQGWKAVSLKNLVDELKRFSDPPMKHEYAGVLQIDGWRGVIYFHDNKGATKLRVQGLPTPIPEITDMMDINGAQHVSWVPQQMYVLVLKQTDEIVDERTMSEQEAAQLNAGVSGCEWRRKHG